MNEFAEDVTLSLELIDIFKGNPYAAIASIPDDLRKKVKPVFDLIEELHEEEEMLPILLAAWMIAAHAANVCQQAYSDQKQRH